MKTYLETLTKNRRDKLIFHLSLSWEHLMRMMFLEISIAMTRAIWLF